MNLREHDIKKPILIFFLQSSYITIIMIILTQKRKTLIQFRIILPTSIQQEKKIKLQQKWKNLILKINNF